MSQQSNDIQKSPYKKVSPVALMICSAAIGSILGFKLYQKYKERKNTVSVITNQCNKILTASAPGKVILTGEHAVVYGVTAISAAINKRTSITIYESTINSGTDCVLTLKLEKALLSWNVATLFDVYKQNVNNWNGTLISDHYDNKSLKPVIKPIDKRILQDHPLYSQINWDKQITMVLLLLLYQSFNELFTDKIFSLYGIIIKVQSDIPIGAGLGSSAAWSTSLSSALYNYWVYAIDGKRKTKICLKDVQTVSQIWKLSYEAERINHGTPSGIDNTTSVYGGYIKFKNKANFNVLDIKKQFIHQIPLLVINTGIVGNTKKLVSNVRSLYNKHSSILDTIFSSIEEIGENLIDNLTNKDIEISLLHNNISELFSLNHGLLLSIGVGHNVINKIQNICTEFGYNNGYKITGAGGGGCVIIPLTNYVSIKSDDGVIKLRNLLAKIGFDSYMIETGQSGVTCKFY